MQEILSCHELPYVDALLGRLRPPRSTEKCSFLSGAGPDSVAKLRQHLQLHGILYLLVLLLLLLRFRMLPKPYSPPSAVNYSGAASSLHKATRKLLSQPALGVWAEPAVAL